MAAQFEFVGAGFSRRLQILRPQNIYFSATCVSRMLVRVLLILPKVEEVMLVSGLPQFGWFGKLNASSRNWSA